MQRLASENIQARPTLWSPWGLTLATRVNAHSLKSFAEGLFEIQDEGSQLLAQLVDAQPGEKVVDACAGVGGKTLALSAQMHNQGKLFAYDVGRERLAQLSRRARRAGARNIHVHTLPQGSQADAFLQSMHNEADRVLVDAPCSGLGALRRNPDARYRFQPSDFHRFPALQEEILNRFSLLVRKGGRLVYATCSIVRAENEIVAEQFLHTHSDFRLIPSNSVLSPDLSPGPFLKLFPHHQGTDGFFAAVFERA
jgi:16S rRNA (cytosine967-C5)-methyltransferase